MIPERGGGGPVGAVAELALADDSAACICSAISAGTEMLVYQSRFPRDLESDSVIAGLRGGFKYPLAYGYANAGVVRNWSIVPINHP